MQFSIFGVPFKCTKDMFTWEKIKWSIFVYWAQLWRGALLGVVAMLVCFCALLIPAFVDSDALAQFNDSKLDVKIAMHIAYSAHYWYQHLLVPGIVLLCVVFVGVIWAALYIQYYSMFKKNYCSFSRQFNKPEVSSLWSWGFWKPAILITVSGLVIGLIVGFVLGVLMVDESIIQLMGWVVGLVLFHVFIHGGTWGFVPVRKQQPATK